MFQCVIFLYAFISCSVPGWCQFNTNGPLKVRNVSTDPLLLVRTWLREIPRTKKCSMIVHGYWLMHVANNKPVNNLQQIIHRWPSTCYPVSICAPFVWNGLPTEATRYQALWDKKGTAHGPTSHLTPTPDNNVHGANMGPIWGRQDTDGPKLATLILLP